MIVERPPHLFRWLFPGVLFRRHKKDRKIYLTFDDGPIPEVTPWVLNLLDEHNIKATFFMVGDNVRKYPEVYEEVVKRGHTVGNHTMHHLNGMTVSTRAYLRDVSEAHKLIGSHLFRPPHGVLRWSQLLALSARFRVVMFDLVTRDYAADLRAADVYNNVRKYARPGALIVFHDSVKSWPRLKNALPRAIKWLREAGYEFGTL